ncbi:hypothetical protein PVAND_002024 [Polypedilum vanderplanki]|uniref:Cysteine protease n=1 Tax=Polypedilum vanderplanki TaxID=319348 RepID=A0A9J6BQZ1_POLVA|nr:hypothetical protein PVAND_002024 [Polypedilum vanderplanki]
MSNKSSMLSKLADTISEYSWSDASDGASTTTATASNAVKNNELQPNNGEFKDRVETKLMSLWHNMKYGWGTKMRSNFNKESAIWFLGRCYHQKVTPSPSLQYSTIFDHNTINPSSTHHADNNSRLMTSSFHEELPTSYDSYLNQFPTKKCRSNIDVNYDDDDFNNHVEPAIEPAEETGQDVIGDYEEGLDGFKRDFITRIWMTYRKDFAMMPAEVKSNSPNSPSSSNGGYTSDCGWGCMIRSGQMLLAQALVIHFLGRSWRYDPNTQLFSTTEDHIHRKIVRWFGDQVSKASPFSIHKLVELGKRNGKKVGEWYGPGSVAHVLKDAVKQASKENIDLASLHVYVSQDCTIYNQDIFDECYSNEIQTVPWKNNLPSTSSNSFTLSPSRNRSKVITWKQLILLIPLRLGHEKLNPIYSDCLKAMLSLEWCIGIIGGRPKHSLYFVGYQDDKLIHLDPHYCQDLVDVNAENFSLTSFHCRSARKMKISKMDPSCCIGFYIASREEYDRFQNTIQPYLQPIKNYAERHKTSQFTTSSSSCISAQSNIEIYPTSYPMFVFNPRKLNDEEARSLRIHASPLNSLKHLHIANDTHHPQNDDETEDDWL